MVSSVDFHVPIIGPIIKDSNPFKTMDKPFAAGSFSSETYLGIINDWKTALEPFDKPRIIEAP